MYYEIYRQETYKHTQRTKDGAIEMIETSENKEAAIEGVKSVFNVSINLVKMYATDDEDKEAEAAFGILKEVFGK